MIVRPNPDYFLSQHQKPYGQGQYQRYSEERPVFSESRDERPLRPESDSYRECFAQYQGGAGFDQIPTDYQPFGGSNNRGDREMDYSRNHSHLREEGFFSVGPPGPQYQQDSALMETHFPQQRNFTATAGFQKEDDLEYDRGFPLNVPPRDRESDSGQLDPNVSSKSLGPMFVIGQNNPPPGAGRRW